MNKQTPDPAAGPMHNDARPGAEPPRLYATPPWKPHRFPDKRITRRVVRASRAYRCDSRLQIDELPGVDHSPVIAAGDEYVKVGMRPEPGTSSGWRTRRMCRHCALHFELATEVAP